MNSKILKNLLMCPSPTGLEGEVAKLVESSAPGKLMWIDRFKNVAKCIGYYGPDPKEVVMISAHHDELGFMISSITDNGNCRLTRSSGEDRRVLVGLKLQVLGDKGPVEGVICYKPIHLQDESEYRDPTRMEDLYLSLGCTKKEEVEDLGIHVGHRAVFPKQENIIMEFGPNKDMVVGPGLDDKAGVFACITAFTELLKIDQDLKNAKIQVVFCSASGEESGLRGIKVAAKKINPTISIDLDVTPAIDSDAGISKEKYGDIEVGKGVVIEYGPDKDPEIAKRMATLAKDNGITFQYGVSRAGGTNTAKIQEVAEDCSTMLLSIPIINLHQPLEMCKWDDIRATNNLLVEYIKSLCKL